MGDKPSLRDSDSGHSPTDDEKKIGVATAGYAVTGPEQLPPDPDAGLSEEERKAIVRFAYHDHALPLVHCLAIEVDLSSIGPQASPQARLAPHTMALPLVSDQLPRPHQYRQCEARWPHEIAAHDFGTVQFGALNLLRLLLFSGAIDQHLAEAPSTPDLYPLHHGALGHLHDLHGLDAQFPRLDGL